MGIFGKNKSDTKHPVPNHLHIAVELGAMNIEDRFPHILQQFDDIIRINFGEEMSDDEFNEAISEFFEVVNNQSDEWRQTLLTEASPVLETLEKPSPFNESIDYIDLKVVMLRFNLGTRAMSLREKFVQD